MFFGLGKNNGSKVQPVQPVVSAQNQQHQNQDNLSNAKFNKKHGSASKQDSEHEASVFETRELALGHIRNLLGDKSLIINSQNLSAVLKSVKSRVNLKSHDFYMVKAALKKLGFGLNIES